VSRPAPSRSLAATGVPAVLPALALGALVGAAVLRRRRH
jgi:hypothetical protein